MNDEEILRSTVLKLGFWAAIAVAIFTVGFIIALPLTFDFSNWKGIEQYVSLFNPMQILTVIPSILLASSFIILTVCVHYYASKECKIWSHLAIAFGLVYAIISTTNYLIQLLTVIPSITNNYINDITVFVTGFPHSIFYALMASYIFMCIASLFMAFVFNGEKIERNIKLLFIGVGLSGPLCLVGAFVGTSIIMPLSGILWFLCLTIGSIKIAIYFKKLLAKN